MDGGHTPLAAGPLPAYRAKLASGELGSDPAQVLAAERLQALWLRLRGYAARPAKPQNGFLGRLLRQPRADDIPEDYPHGLYLAGEVGRGKSMLMDLFFATAEVSHKRRIHFHEFMQDVHKRIHAWRRGPERLADPGTDDPIPPLADQIAAEAALLCFDEFQINDIADAMILGRLFKALFARGVVVVATSNTVPDELFAGQPGRDAFLPFMALIKQYLEVIVMHGSRDWRRARLRLTSTWHVPGDAKATRALDQAFADLTERQPAKPERLVVMGRALKVPLAA